MRGSGCEGDETKDRDEVTQHEPSWERGGHSSTERGDEDYRERFRPPPPWRAAAGRGTCRRPGRDPAPAGRSAEAWRTAVRPGVRIAAGAERTIAVAAAGSLPARAAAAWAARSIACCHRRRGSAVPGLVPAAALRTVRLADREVGWSPGVLLAFRTRQRRANQLAMDRPLFDIALNRLVVAIRVAVDRVATIERRLVVVGRARRVDTVIDDGRGARRHEVRLIRRRTLAGSLRLPRSARRCRPPPRARQERRCPACQPALPCRARPPLPSSSGGAPARPCRDARRRRSSSGSA